MILSPAIANGRLTNMPSEANKFNFSSVDKSFNLSFNPSSLYLAPWVLNNLLTSTPVLSIISSNSFSWCCVVQYQLVRNLRHVYPKCNLNDIKFNHSDVTSYSVLI